MTFREKLYIQKVSIHHKFKFYLPKHSQYLHTGFQKFSRDHTPGPLYWVMDTSPDPIPLAASRSTSALPALAQSLQYLVRPLPTTGKFREKSGNFIWPGEWPPWMYHLCSQKMQQIEFHLAWSGHRGRIICVLKRCNKCRQTQTTMPKQTKISQEIEIFAMDIQKIVYFADVYLFSILSYNEGEQKKLLRCGDYHFSNLYKDNNGRKTIWHEKIEETTCRAKTYKQKFND